MPLFDFLCPACGQTSELLVSSADAKPNCPECGQGGLKKLLAVPASLSGTGSRTMPGPGDTACCGSTPGHTACAGPGSCCGRVPH